MNRRKLALCALLLTAALTATGCARQAEVDMTEPASVTPAKSGDLNTIVLTEVAFKNLAIQTAAVREDTSATQTATGTKRNLVIPTSALVFNSQGTPFVYTSPSPRTYIRAPLVIYKYRGSDVVLTTGPAPGTQVVTVGDPELLGIEYGVGEE